MIQSFKGKTPVIGRNVYIAPTASVIGDVTIGDNSSVWPSAVLRGDMNRIVVGERTNIQDGAVIHTNDTQPTLIGNDVTIGHQAHIHSAEVGDEVLIGIAAVVLDGTKIESGVLIGAGALVVPRTNVPAGSLVVGMPAGVKRPLSETERTHIRENALEYLELARHYRDSETE